MRKIYIVSFIVMLVCIGCEWKLKPNEEKAESLKVTVERYDRLESLYLTTGDYSALRQMNIGYPMQTRMLIEDVLRIGRVNEPDINAKFLDFYQDSTLQVLIADVQQQYGNLDDVSRGLTQAFERLRKDLPDVAVPQVYAQIGSFDQSIIVGDDMLGISLDKYLGADYPFYLDNYPEEQRRMMVRSMIVPDCMGFYLLSLFPLPFDREVTQQERDLHMGKIQWVVNRITGRRIFTNDHVAAVDRYMKHNKQIGIEQLLSLPNSLIVG